MTIVRSSIFEGVNVGLAVCFELPTLGVCLCCNASFVFDLFLLGLAAGLWRIDVAVLGRDTVLVGGFLAVVTVDLTVPFCGLFVELLVGVTLLPEVPALARLA